MGLEPKTKFFSGKRQEHHKLEKKESLGGGKDQGMTTRRGVVLGGRERQYENKLSKKKVFLSPK